MNSFIAEFSRSKRAGTARCLFAAAIKQENCWKVALNVARNIVDTTLSCIVLWVHLIYTNPLSYVVIMSRMCLGRLGYSNKCTLLSNSRPVNCSVRRVCYMATMDYELYDHIYKLLTSPKCFFCSREIYPVS